jgi:hypothetical protein
MPQQQVMRLAHPEQKIASHLAQPHRLDVFFHAFKTCRLIKALLIDRRIQAYRKILFFVTLAALLAILLFPDAIGETVLSIVLPIIGTIAGVPLDAGFDWLAFALVGIHLLRYFPADIVSEHYTNIFEK